MSENMQDQRDEVLALESILADTGRLEVLDGPDVSEKHLYLIQIEIPMKLEDDGITVELCLPEEEDMSHQQVQAAGLPQKDRPKIDRSISGKHWNCSVRVQHLPPLVMHVSLPSTYPSKDPPNAHVSAVWLNASQITQLQGQLQQLWEESANMPVLYTWIDWLENSLLSFLEISDTLVLQWSDRNLDVLSDIAATEQPEQPEQPEQIDTEETTDSIHETPNTDNKTDPATMTATTETYDEEGAVGGAIPSSESFKRQASIHLQTDLLYLVRYSLGKEQQEFTDAVHECCICFCTKTGKHFVRLNQCRHHFCRECAATYCTEHIKEGTVDSLKCPDPNCDTELPPGLMQDILDVEIYQRYEKLTLQKALDKMGDVTWCPRCNQPAIKEDNTAGMASCGHCYFVFCLKCKSTWHSGSDCSPYFHDIQKLLDSVKKGGANKETVLAEFQKMFELAKGMMTVKKNTKPCPHCGVPIQKNSGCNHMSCTQCHQSFTWTHAKWSAASTEHMAEADEGEKMLSFALMTCISFTQQVKELKKLLDHKESADEELTHHEMVQRKVNELLTVLTIGHTTKPCTLCGTPIEKVSGCNSVVCTHCGRNFNYGTSAWTSGQVASRLDADSQMLQILLNSAQTGIRDYSKYVWKMANMEVTGQKANKVKCVFCQQLCLKLSTRNIIKCFSCGKEFCFLCGKIIHNATERKKHFPKSCPLHSEDTVPFKNGQIKTKK